MSRDPPPGASDKPFGSELLDLIRSAEEEAARALAASLRSASQPVDERDEAAEADATDAARARSRSVPPPLPRSASTPPPLPRSASTPPPLPRLASRPPAAIAAPHPAEAETRRIPPAVAIFLVVVAITVTLVALVR